MAEKALSNIVSIVIISLIFITVFATEVLKPRMDVSDIIGTVSATCPDGTPGNNCISSHADLCPKNDANKEKADDCEADSRYWFNWQDDVCACTCRKYNYQTSTGDRITKEIARSHLEQEYGSWNDFPACAPNPDTVCCAYDTKSKLSMFDASVTTNQCKDVSGIPMGSAPKPKSQWAPPSKA